MAGGLDSADVKERIARTVSQFDEAEALLLVEPLDRRVALRPRGSGCRTGRTAIETAAATAVPTAEATARGCLIRPARLGTTLIEAALLRPPEITTTSHRKLAKTVRRPSVIEYRVRAVPDGRFTTLSSLSAAVTKNNAIVLTESGLHRKMLVAPLGKGSSDFLRQITQSSPGEASRRAGRAVRTESPNVMRLNDFASRIFLGRVRKMQIDGR